MNEPDALEGGKETGRIEAFSDGVFAIAITLLVLDLKVMPFAQLGSKPLLDFLREQWASYLAYVISFLTILIMWVNHHMLFRHIKRTNHPFLILNGLLLMGITVVPFPTSLVADYIQHDNQYHDARVALAVYSGLFTTIALVYNMLWRYASAHDRLLGPRVDRRAVAGITRAYRLGPLWYFIAFVAAIFNPAASLAINMGLAVFFAIPSAAMRPLREVWASIRNDRPGRGAQPGR